MEKQKSKKWVYKERRGVLVGKMAGKKVIMAVQFLTLLIITLGCASKSVEFPGLRKENSSSRIRKECNNETSSLGSGKKEGETRNPGEKLIYSGKSVGTEKKGLNL